MNGRALWQKAGRLTGPTPLMVARRGQVRPPTREEAAAMLEAAIAALEAAGVAVRVLNLEGYAVVMVRGGRWRNEADFLLADLAGHGAASDGLQSRGAEAVRPVAYAHAD